MTTKPDEPVNSVMGAIATLALHILALPFVLVVAVTNIRKLVAVNARLRAGVMTCKFCAFENTLNMMTRCSCGAVEPGSRLRCSFCGTIFEFLPCGGCGATLRVL